MTLAQLLQTLDPAEQKAVQAVYVERLSLVAAAAQLSIDQATLGAALAAAFRAVARWVDTAGGEDVMVSADSGRPRPLADDSRVS